MSEPPSAVLVAPDRSGILDGLEVRLQGRLAGQVSRLRLECRGNGLVLRGLAHTYFARQLAEQAVDALTDWPLVANEIEVSGRPDGGGRCGNGPAPCGRAHRGRPPAESDFRKGGGP